MESIPESKPLSYLASISYALYIWHILTTNGWFMEGSKIAIYTKRLLGICITFAIAHLSTFYFESYWTKVGRRLVRSGLLRWRDVLQPTPNWPVVRAPFVREGEMFRMRT